MKSLTFVFDGDANGYLSEEITICEPVIVRISLASRAPVVTLKQESDGGYANYGQTPEQRRSYEINIRPTGPMAIKLATPVKVEECYII